MLSGTLKIWFAMLGVLALAASVGRMITGDVWGLALGVMSFVASAVLLLGLWALAGILHEELVDRSRKK